MSFNLFKTPAVFRIVFATKFVCESQLRFVSIFMPRKLKLLTNSIAIPAMFSCGSETFFCGTWKTIAFDLFTFNDSLLTLSQSLTLVNSLLILNDRSVCLSKTFAVVNNVVSSAYMMNLNFSLHLMISLIYIVNKRGPSRLGNVCICPYRIPRRYQAFYGGGVRRCVQLSDGELRPKHGKDWCLTTAKCVAVSNTLTNYK